MSSAPGLSMYSVSKRWSLDAAPETTLVLRAQPGGNIEVPQVSPEQMSALKQALPKYTQQGGVLVPLLETRSCLHVQPSCPSDVLLLVREERGGGYKSSWQPATSINNEWAPLRISATDSSKVTFVGASSALKLGKQSQDNLTAVRQSRDRIKKRAQLTYALDSNKREYARAKEHAEVSDVGALAIERDRIEEELAIMEAEDKEAEQRQAQQRMQEQQLQQQQQQRYNGWSYPQRQVYGQQQVAAAKQPASEGVSPSWSEQVTVYRTIDLPFGYCRFGEGASSRLYNIVKVQTIDTTALPTEQVVTICKNPQLQATQY